MNYRIISRLLSVILLATAAAFLVSLVVGLLNWQRPGEQRAVWGFAGSIVIALALAYVLARLGKGDRTRMFRKEGLTLVGLGWLLASLVGAVPYMLILPGCSFADAFFESTSGITTTGSTVFSNLEEMPRSLLFWRSISQWIGGLGVVVLFVALLSSLGAGAKLLFSNESSAQTADLQSGRVQSDVKQIIMLYGCTSVACLLLYWTLGMGFYEAVCHMFTTVSTGGFSTYDDSFGAFGSPALEWTSIVFMIIGGTNFFFMLLLLRKEFGKARRYSETYAFYGIIFLGTVFVAGYLALYDDASHPFASLVREAAFQVVSITTTTGYATVDSDQWPPSTHIFLLFLMIVGGSSGSTSGGVKVIRVLVGFKVCAQALEKAYRPHIVRPIIVNGRTLDTHARDSIAFFMILAVFSWALAIIGLSLLAPNTSFKGLISAATATLFNIGPGFSEVGARQTFAGFSGLAKVYMSLLMIMGRIEFFALLVLFSPSLWRKFD